MPILDSESVLNQAPAALAYSSIDMKRKLLAHTVLQTCGTHMSMAKSIHTVNQTETI